MKVVLASTSPWRRALLAQVGLRADGEDPGVDEARVLGGDPVETARLRARAKAQAVAQRRPEDVVVGADQVAHLDGEAFGKPTDPDDHRRRLRSLAGRRHALTSAVTVVWPGGRMELEETTWIRFRADLTDEEIADYVASGEGSGCAGGYQAEGRGAWLIEAVEGDWFNVIGLPVNRLLGVLRTLGVSAEAAR